MYTALMNSVLMDSVLMDSVLIGNVLSVLVYVSVRHVLSEWLKLVNRSVFPLDLG